MSKSHKFILQRFLEIRFADPVSSMKLVHNYFIYGTLMGRINLYNIAEDKKIKLSETNSENISDISFNDEEKSFYIGIGDEEIKIYYLNNISEDSLPQNQSINVYETDFDHSKNCENAFLFLTKNTFFRIQLPQVEEGTLKIVLMESDYDIKYFNEDKDQIKTDKYKNALPTSNYTVPFDFDGKKFLWVEFLSSKTRNICVSEIPLLKEDKPYKYLLDVNIGHISQAKLLPNNRVVIVHSLNKCEIRELNSAFTLIERFDHIGEEVLAIDIFINEENENIINHKNIDDINTFKQEIVFNKESKEATAFKKSKKYNINTISNRILETSDNQKNKNQEGKNDDDGYLTIRQNTKSEKIFDINNICISTLDIDGNVNLYKNKKETNLFNLFNIENIPQDHKDKSFFSMGYAYYMKTDLNYFCISSDHGCYIIKYNNK